jgi:hypothetical protein
MNTEALDTTTIEQQKSPQVFTQEEVEKLIRDRTEKERVNSRLKSEENEKLKKQLEEYEAKLQKGTATASEIQQLDTAKQAAGNAQMQGFTPEQVQAQVQMAMEQKEMEGKLTDAYQKDPEFKKLVDENKKATEARSPNALSIEEVLATAYLPNSIAVVKHLMKDPKSMTVFKTALSRAPYDGGINAMMVLNNFSDRLSDKQEMAHPSTYEPAAELSDNSDESQAFDLKNYIDSKY